jgi:hypothetical protein
MPQVEQELHTPGEHISSPLFISCLVGFIFHVFRFLVSLVHVTQSLVFGVVFCKSLFVPLFSFFCSLINRFLHTFLGKIGWSSASDRNFMSFREWSAAKRARRHNNFYHEWKITRAFPTTHVSTYFFRKPTTFTIANS